jgi:hypothetical protein
MREIELGENASEPIQTTYLSSCIRNQYEQQF